MFYISVIVVVIISAGITIPFILIINNSIALSGIYYEINYKGTVQNFEVLIEKSESFEYKKYCKYRDSWGEGPVNTSEYYYSNIDRDLIDSLKLKIDIEKEKFHLYPHDCYTLFYSVEVTNQSLIYLTYNNNNIIKAEYANHTEIFSAERVWDYYNNNYTQNWEGNWYLNFTLIPFVPSNSYTIALNDTFLVKMNLEYQYSCGVACYGNIKMEQYICFNSNIKTTFVYFPFALHLLT